jgi:uncharacterized protein
MAANLAHQYCRQILFSHDKSRRIRIPSPTVNLKITDIKAAICQLPKDSSIPSWVHQSSFYSITRAEQELSIVCNQANVPDGVKCEKNWSILQVDGSLDFTQTGILASVANPLAQANISIFAISTFNTDYVLVRTADLEKACSALESAEFTIDKPPELTA